MEALGPLVMARGVEAPPHVEALAAPPASSAISEAAIESGEGEYEPEELASSRRGDKSVRDRNLRALEEAVFPPFPDPPPAEEAFALPNGFIDADAPLSARKWYARPRRLFFSAV